MSWSGRLFCFGCGNGAAGFLGLNSCGLRSPTSIQWSWPLLWESQEAVTADSTSRVFRAITLYAQCRSASAATLGATLHLSRPIASIIKLHTPAQGSWRIKTKRTFRAETRAGNCLASQRVGFQGVVSCGGRLPSPDLGLLLSS